MISFRWRLIQFAVSWLKNTNAARLLYTIGVHLDVCADYMRFAVRKRFLEPDSFDALPQHGAMRKIPRGPYESDEVYASRLPDWYDVHAIRGGAWGMLEELYKYFQPSPFLIELFYPSGMHYTLNTDGSIDWDFLGPLDGNPAQWARWTLLFHWPNAFGPTPAWDTPTWMWDDGGIWDSELPASDAAAIRTIPEAWNAAHALGTMIVLSPGAETWDFPTGVWDDGGTWNQAASAGVAWLYTT